MSAAEKVTSVVFRVWKIGSVIALFEVAHTAKGTTESIAIDLALTALKDGREKALNPKPGSKKNPQFLLGQLEASVDIAIGFLSTVRS